MTQHETPPVDEPRPITAAEIQTGDTIGDNGENRWTAFTPLPQATTYLRITPQDGEPEEFPAAFVEGKWGPLFLIERAGPDPIQARDLSCQALQRLDPTNPIHQGTVRVTGAAEEIARRGEGHVYGCELIGHIPDTTSQAIARFAELAAPAQSRAFELADDADRPADAAPIVDALKAGSDLRDHLQDLAAENARLRVELAAAQQSAHRGGAAKVQIEYAVRYTGRQYGKPAVLTETALDPTDCAAAIVKREHLVGVQRESGIAVDAAIVARTITVTDWALSPIGLEIGTPVIYSCPWSGKDEEGWAYAGPDTTLPGRIHKGLIKLDWIGSDRNMQAGGVDPAHVRPVMA